MVPHLVPLASCDTNTGAVVPCNQKVICTLFEHIELTSAIVPLTVPSASHDAMPTPSASHDQNNHVDLILISSNKCTGVIDDGVGIT